MKGLIQISIQVDFDEIINQEGLEALMKFTGATSKEGVASFYMDSLAKKIIDSNLREDHIAYTLEGNIVPDESMSQEENEFQAIEDYYKEHPYEPVEEVSGHSKTVEMNVKEHIDNVSMNKGIPHTIRVSAEFYDALPLKIKEPITDVSTDVAFLWNGVLTERMVDDTNGNVMEIDYEPYGDLGKGLQMEEVKVFVSNF